MVIFKVSIITFSNLFSMATTCKNCGHQFIGNFCNHCGQSAKTSRIDAEFLWEDIQHGILHYDKGILYTIKQLFLKPGYVIKDYIKGKRVHHFRPISLTIVLATLYVLVYHLTKIDLMNQESDDTKMIFDQILEHYYWFVFITIPLFSWSTALFFRNNGYNFWEYFIFEAFKASQRLIVHLLFLPIIFIINDATATNYIIKGLMFLDFALILWTNLQFFNHLPKLKIFYLSLFSYFAYLLMTILLLMLIIFVFFRHEI